MNRLHSVSKLFLGLLVLCFSACATQSQLGPEDFPVEPVDFTAVEPEEWKLDNGITVLYYHDPEIPVVKGALYMRGGSLHVSDASPLAVGAMGGQMRLGGAGRLSPDALDLELEKLAASVGSSFGEEFGSVSFYSLSSDIDRVFSIFSDVLLRPRFDQGRLSLWKAQSIESIARRRDSPGSVAGISFNTLLFGDRNRFNFVAMPGDVSTIERVDLLRLHRRLVRPDDAILVVTGAITREKLESLIDKHLLAWKSRNTPLPPLPEIAHTPRPGVYFVEMPFEQATIFIGHLGVPRLTEDHVEIDVFNELFGTGGFSSRLMQEIRVKRGLAYSTYGAIVPDVVRGKNLIVIQTKAESTEDAIRGSVDVLKNMQAENVELEELGKVKKSVESSFVFKIDSPEKAVGRKATLRLLNYPPDYDEHFLSTLSDLEPPAIKTVADRRWNPDEFVIVVVGNKTAYNSAVSFMNSLPAELQTFQLKVLPFTNRLITEPAAKR